MIHLVPTRHARPLSRAATARRRFRLDLIESAPRPWRPLLLREVLGVGTMTLALSCTVAVQAWKPEWVAMPTEELEIARFLAPITKRTAPPPREERIEFVGIGGATANSSLTMIADGDTRRATAVNSSEAKGDQTIIEEAADGEPLRAYTEVEVDSVAIPDPNGEAPIYPPMLLKLGVEGVVMASFVVDSTGHADVNTFHLLQDADPEFVAAVKNALSRMRYRPAMFGGRRVNQLAEQRFSFRITPQSPPPNTPGRG
jgi:protein TonB